MNRRGLPIRANNIHNHYPRNYVPPPAVIPPTSPPVQQPVLGVYKFVSRVSSDNAITALKDNHIPLFQPVINNVELTLGTIIQINKFTLQQEADPEDRPIAPGMYGTFKHKRVY